MKLSNHCRTRTMTKSIFDVLGTTKHQSIFSSLLRLGGMTTIISACNTLTLKQNAHHHQSEIIPASRCVPVFKQWLLDQNATYASFSLPTDIQDLFKTSCLMDRLSTNTSGFLGTASYPLALISSAISLFIGTSFSFTKEASECHSVSHDVLFSAVCISDDSDRANLYPTIGYFILDIPSEESLTNALLYMTGRDDFGQYESGDITRDESANKSRNGGVVATATTPEKVMLFFINNE